MWFPNRFDTNQTVQALKITRGWDVWILNCTIRLAKTKALVSFAVAKLRLYFRICRLFVFSSGGSFYKFCFPDILVTGNHNQVIHV